MTELYVLNENASGYGLLHVKEWEQIGQESEQVQAATADHARFSSICQLKAFIPFADAGEALENMQAIADGTVTETLRNFLEQNLPKKKSKYTVGISDPTLGKALGEEGFPVSRDKNVLELLRGCRQHFARFVKNLTEFDLDRARCGLGHSFSRTKMQFDPNRQDKPIIQSIALIDSLDKNINLFAMRVREWYCWHFPELGKIVTDNIVFAKICKVIRIKEQWDDEKYESLLEACDTNEELAQEILTAMKLSMGQEIAEADMANIETFADQVIKLAAQRKHLGEYLGTKLNVVAPNLKSLIGDTVAARLISHAGSLVNLAKYPASTVQILGAEKALFRALKTKQSNVFGEKLRDQVEERLNFLTGGVAPKKNIEVMREAIGAYDEVLATHEGSAPATVDTTGEEKKKKKKKRKSEVQEDAEMTDPVESESVEIEPKKSKKKKRKTVTEEEAE